MKIITWNVNSIRVRLPRLLALLERHEPDLVCLQETKVTDDTFPFEEIAALGYRAEVHGQKTYNGVALLSREPVQDVRRGFSGDPVPEEARVIAGSLRGLRVYDLYVINGKAVGDPKYDRKLAWLDALAADLAEREDPAAPLLLVGDFNITPDDRDVHDPERWAGSVHCSGPERERLHGLMGWGLQDLFRLFQEEGGHFSWWDYRGGAFHRGWGLRIDLALGSASVAARCVDVEIEREERKTSTGEGKPSDHAPVIVTLEGEGFV